MASTDQSSLVQLIESADANQSHRCSKDIVACTVKGRRFVCSKHAKEGDVKYIAQAVQLKSQGGKLMHEQVSSLSMHAPMNFVVALNVNECVRVCDV